jgi:AcrR family transcriptional regulator
MAKRGRPSVGKEKILSAATELFFELGYQATAVSDILKKAGVSKPTFYAHFESKEELCLEYLRTRQIGDAKRFEDCLKAERDPVKRFLVPLTVLQDVQRDRNFRGCPYFNMLSEMGTQMPLVRMEVANVSKGFESLFRDLANELIDSAPSRYAGIDVEELVAHYNLLFSGAILLSQELESLEPIWAARQQLLSTIGECSAERTGVQEGL